MCFQDSSKVIETLKQENEELNKSGNNAIATDKQENEQDERYNIQHIQVYLAL